MPVDVATVLTGIGPMLDAVVLDANAEVLVPHVDPPAVHDDLRPRSRQSRVKEDQSGARLLRRLGPAVHQLDHLTQLA